MPKITLFDHPKDVLSLPGDPHNTDLNIERPKNIPLTSAYKGKTRFFEDFYAEYLPLIRKVNVINSKPIKLDLTHVNRNVRESVQSPMATTPKFNN